MAAADPQLKFVVVGAPPRALAISAESVRRVLPGHDFSGVALDLTLEDEAPAPDSSEHVLFVGPAGAAVALRIRGELELLTVRSSEVLPLPALVGRPARLSHVIAPRGVPLMFVLDLSRLDESPTAGSPWQARSVQPEI